MKTHVLLTLFCAQILSFVALAQHQHIVPFEDYRECYTGFKNSAGDTIHEAKFSNVFAVRARNSDYPNKYCWIVEEMGRYGTLNPTGDYVVKSQYDTIFQCAEYRNDFIPQSWLVTARQGRYGMIDFEGNEVLPPVYSMIQAYEPWLKVRNPEGKIALMDSSLNLLVPFKYEELSYHQMRDYITDTVVIYSFYTAQQNGLFGLLKEDLTPILPFEFESVHVRGTDNYFEQDQLYVVAMKNGANGLFAFGGKQLIPFEYEWIDLVDFEEFQQKDQLPIALAYAKKKYRFWNLSTGANSERFHTIRPFGGKAVGMHKNGNWTVIDSNGSSIGKGKKDWYPIEETLSLKDSIVLVQTNSKRNIEHASLLFHYGNGQYSSEEAGWLMRLDLDDETFCWTASNKKITIYNTQLEKVNSLDQKFSIVMEDLEEEDVPYDLSIQILENRAHLLGGFNARGNEVIPQIYTKARVVLKELPHKRFRYLKTPDYFELSNDTCLAYYSLNGELIRSLNFSQIYPLSANYYVAKSGKYTSVLDANYNLVLDSCTRAFQGNGLNSNWSRNFSTSSQNNPYPIFAFRNQKALELVNGTFVPMDSTRYDFKHTLQLQFEVLIDRSGTIVSPEGAEIRDMGAFYLLKMDESSVVLKNKNGVTHLELDDVRSFGPSPGHGYHCILNNGKQGIYNARHSRWDLPLAYQEISPITGNQSKAKYCIKRNEVNLNWQFYSANGQLVLDLSLDTPISRMFSSNVVQIGGNFGVMSDKLEMYLPAEYNYISKFKHSLFLRKDELWYISNSTHTQVSKGYTSISTHYYPKGRLVFQQNLIGVLDENNVEIIAPTDEQTLLSKYDLAQLLISTTRKQMNQFPIVTEKNAERAKQINNRIILEASRFQTTKNDIMPLGIEHHTDPKYIRALNRTERKKVEYPSFLSKSYYACVIYSSTSTWGERDYNKKESYRHYNYEWINGKHEKIELADLFKSPYYEPHLDSLIIDYINEKQVYGISCVNLEEVVARVKRNFLLAPEGIILLSMDRSSRNITIPYEDLRDYLKRPEEFME